MSSPSDTPERLIYMANQIGKFFTPQKRIDPVDGIAAHIADFWDPAMRAKIIAYVEKGGEGLDPEAKEAILRIAKRAADAKAELAG